VHDLHRHLAARDRAVVQGGLTTTMELTASGRPRIYVPCVITSSSLTSGSVSTGTARAAAPTTTLDGPEALAHSIAAEIGRPVTTVG
jgi:hypothetical protein